MRYSGQIGILLIGALVMAPGPGAAQDGGDDLPTPDEPLFVNYGPRAAPRQGDNDHHQAIYLSVPAATAGPLYLRIFDADTGRRFDQLDSRRPSSTRFTLFGGDGAFVPEAAEPEGLSEIELTSGTVLAEESFGFSRDADATWQTVATLDPDDGQRVGDEVVFRLVADAVEGANGNVFDVTLSTAEDDTVAPEGLRMFSFSPTVRMPRRGVLNEVRLAVPDTTTALNVGNFDAADGDVFLTTAPTSYPLIASGQGDWQETTVAIPPWERGRMAAVTLSGGDEYPNDASYYATDQNGALIPFELPSRLFPFNGRPTAFAVADLMGTCKTARLSGAVSSDPEGAPLTYTWDFGDGSGEDGMTLTHTYEADGRYTAALEVSDGSTQVGNGDRTTVEIFVKDPPVPRSEKRLLVAAGEENTFDGAASIAGRWSIARHEWSFGDGKRAFGPSVAHAFAEPGEYRVTHAVVDDSGHPCDTAMEEFTVRVNAQPVAEAGPDQRISIGEEAEFDAGASSDSDGRLVTYEWDFGDGATATGTVVHHAYDDPATYIVRLMVRDDSDVANSSAEDTLAAIVNDPPTAEAGPDRSVAIGEPVPFDAGRSEDRDGDIIAYVWDFGDGKTGGGPTASHAYDRSGTYTVTLTVTDDSTTDSSTGEDQLSVRVNEPPVADAGPDQLVTASVIAFDGSGSSDADDQVAVYDWDFGDGSTGSGPNPSHVYVEPGTYDVRLTVTDASGTIRNSADDTMQVVVNARPIADAGPDLVGAPGESLTFQASRSVDPDGSIGEYEWDFRDGGSGSGPIVKHAFSEPGTYAVRLNVVDDTGQAEAIDYAETTAFINRQPVAVAGPDIFVAPGQVVRLSAHGSYDTDGRIVGYRWYFADRDEALEGADIFRAYNIPGVYPVQLTVTDDSGASNGSAADSLEIAVNHRPVANAGPDIFTDAGTITFDGARSVDADGDPLTYVWDFGDGNTGAGAHVTHTYVEGGTYPVVLTVDDGTGLANARARTAIDVRINRPPVAVAGENREVCTGDIIAFDGSDSADPEGGVLRYAWDFGDGTRADIVNPTKSYNVGGTYPVILTVKDDSGLSNGGGRTEVAVRVDQGPVADAGEDIRACAKTEVVFDGSGSTDIDGVVNSFNWDFGDGSFGGGEAPVHIYDEPGTYRVFLTIDGERAGLCSSVSIDEISVAIVEGPVAVIDAPAAVPVADEVSFDGSASFMKDGEITVWSWDFGDGSTATGPRVTHRYDSPGTYTVSLMLTSDSPSPTCQRVSSQHLITVNGAPVADAGDDKHVAAHEETVFDGSASHDPDGALVEYEWDLGDGSSATGLEVRHRYREAGNYTARLRVRDGAGLANSTAVDEVSVIVNPSPDSGIDGPSVVCVGEVVTWRSAAAEASDDMTFLWAFGDGAGDNEHSVTHAYSRPGHYSLVLTTDDGRERVNSRRQTTVPVHVNRPPHAEAGPYRMVCPGDIVLFDGSASVDPDGALTAFRWDFDDGAFAAGATASHVFDEPGHYRVTLAVTDDSGSRCATATDTVEVFVNAPPVAVLDLVEEIWVGGANDALLFDGSASYDPDGQALSHSWQIGPDIGAFGERVRGTLTSGGEIPITLTVSDTSGLACGTTSSTIDVIARQRE